MSHMWDITESETPGDLDTPITALLRWLQILGRSQQSRVCTQNERVRIIVLAMVLAGLTPCLQAQLIPGSVRGRITDPASAIIPGVTVELRNVASGVVLRTVSNAEAAYLCEFVTPGRYELTASHQGFKTTTRVLGEVSQKVIVTGVALLLEAVDSIIRRGPASSFSTAPKPPLAGFVLTSPKFGVLNSGKIRRRREYRSVPIKVAHE